MTDMKRPSFNGAYRARAITSWLGCQLLPRLRILNRSRSLWKVHVMTNHAGSQISELEKSEYATTPARGSLLSTFVSAVIWVSVP